MEDKLLGDRRRPPEPEAAKPKVAAGEQRQGRTGALRRLMPYIGPYRGPFIASFVFSFLAIAAETTQPLIVARFVDEVLVGRRTDRLIPYALTVFALGAALVGSRALRRNWAGTVSTGVENDLRNDLYRHLQALSVSFHDGWQSGQLVSRAVSDISRIRRFLGFGLTYLVIVTFTFVVVIAQQFRLDWVLALITTVFALPVAFWSIDFARRWRKLSKRSQNDQGELTSVIEETATGVRIIKAFGRMKERSELYSDRAATLLDTNTERVTLRARFWSKSTLSLNLSLALVLLAGGVRVVGGELTLGDLVAFVEYTLMLAFPVREIGWILAMAEEASAGAERILEIMDTEPEIADRPGAVELAEAHGHIRFEDAGLLYEGTDAWVLRDFTLDVAPGETLALVGMTGSGKSTALSLVGRFYDPTTGRVTLDGHDVRDLTLRSLRSHIGVAFEDPILFSLSVRENLTMGAPDATDEDLWAALEATQAAEFVRELPWGLDTRVGEQGHSLSGGQRQRLALARAVVGEPRVLVLDNPLSSVDVHTEAAIERALQRILQGRTALLVAHRPSTILLADRVALLHDGRVVATGTHHELLETVPLYRRVLASDVSERAAVEGPQGPQARVGAGGAGDGWVSA